MTDLRTAAQMALDTLDWHIAADAWGHDIAGAAEALRAALAQPEPAAPTVVEPVIFWRCKGCQHAYESDRPSSCDCMSDAGFERVEYYTTPPRAALTQEQVVSEFESDSHTDFSDFLSGVRFAERFHGIGGPRNE